jgi:hypothetical protein
MRNYWIRIAMGALGVFAVGMLVHWAYVTGKEKVVRTFNSSDPISLPIAFLPFRLDGPKVGTVDKVVFLRSDPKHISAVRVQVDLSDPGLVARFKNCLIAIDNLDKLNDQSTFRCQNADTTGKGLVPFGFVRIRTTGDSVPLLLPRQAVKDIQSTRIELSHQGIRMTSMADSLARLADQEADSISAAAGLRADSIRAAADRRADSIQAAADRKAEVIRRQRN